MSTVVSEDRVREMAASVGGLEAILEGERRFKADQEYLENNRERLKEQYPDQWIGIVHLRVVAHGDTADDVLAELREADEDVSGAVLHHAGVEDSTWLLVEGSRCAAWRARSAERGDARM
ncbi:DUF5678 domain-containing protein [Candidatus Poriferisodalis sp.]|uniref:DUF5678 domain-containing protein n=1 Tax=Candidatus Poriferisodalis sp. TaxID=3101277 RepID=UPI003B0200B1